MNRTGILAKLEGIGPVSSLVEKSRTNKEVKSPTSSGIWPVKEFLSSQMTSNDVKNPISIGISPVKRLALAVNRADEGKEDEKDKVSELFQW
jgi:hypothetical protein